MEETSPLITDLALILIVAGAVTLIFKILKQPVVLGYIVAGFLCSPHFNLMPSVVDKADIHTWADIGVIFLLFALGLEFSFKKLMKVGGSAAVAALVIICGMVFLGFSAGHIMGWNTINSLFLGGMIAMSSTSIIYKALDDLGMRHRKFTNMVLGILVIEDIVAIVLMVILSTVAAKNNSSNESFIFGIMKLAFFLLIWFTAGIFIIPSALQKMTKWLNDETMLIVSLGLCLLMVYLATLAGFSAALGAFVMGSILAETIEAEHIEKITKPVKDLFAAIFFTSVGMMVDPEMIAAHIWPIVIITLIVIAGQIVFGTTGIVIAGQPLKNAMQCSFCLTQIGEFAFIIASLGVALHVTEDYLYPIVVAVSVITTFLTPYMIKLAEPLYPVAEKLLPYRIARLIENYTSGAQTVNQRNLWKTFLLALAKIIVIYSVVSLAIVLLMIQHAAPALNKIMPEFWSSMICSVVTIVIISPFLRAIVAKKNHSDELNELWEANKFYRGYLLIIIAVKYLIAVAFVYVVLTSLFTASYYLLFMISFVLVALMVWSRMLKKYSIMIEHRFKQNFHIRENAQSAVPRPQFAGRLLSYDLHLSNAELPPNSPWGGRTLEDLQLKSRFGIDVVAVFRGNVCHNIPGGQTMLFPEDKIQVIGTEEQLQALDAELEKQKAETIISDLSQTEIKLRQIQVNKDSFLHEKALKDSGIRDKFHCLAVGIDRAGEGQIRNPEADFVFLDGDFIWVVGLENDIQALTHELATE